MIRAVAALLFCAAVCGSAEDRLPPLDEAGYRELIQNHRGKVVLVDFWATWCDPCRTEMPLLVSLERNWRSRGLVFVTISADDPEQEREARDFLVKTAVPMPAYRKQAANDEDFINAIDRKWSGALPALFLYDRTGKLVKSFIGETATADIEAELQRCCTGQ